MTVSFSVRSIITLVIISGVLTAAAGCAANEENAVTQEQTTTAAATQPAATRAPETTTEAPSVHTENFEDIVIDESIIDLQNAPGDDLPPVARVADKDISQAEFLYMLNAYKSAVLLNSGIDAASDEVVNFWNRSAANGRTRIEEARERVLAELHQIKICETIADARGIKIEREELENISVYLSVQESRFGGRDAFEKILRDEYGISLSQYYQINETLALRDKLLSIERDALQIPDGEIREYYELNPDIYGDVVRFRQIMFLMEGADIENERTEDETRRLAGETHGALLAGADVNALIEEKSEDPTLHLNGGERVVTAGDLFTPEEILAWAFEAGEGDSAVIETSFGYYVVYLDERAPVSFDDVKRDIEDILRDLRMADIKADWLGDPAYALKVDREVLENIK